MRGGGGKSGDIEQRAASDGNQIRMPVNVVMVNLEMDFGDELVGIFGAFAAGDEDWRTDELKFFGVRGKIIFNLTRKVWLRERK